MIFSHRIIQSVCDSSATLAVKLVVDLNRHYGNVMEFTAAISLGTLILMNIHCYFVALGLTAERWKEVVFRGPS